MNSHAEVRATHRRNGLRWSTHLDLRGILAPKDIKEEFARRTAESSSRLAWPNRHPLVSSGPHNLEPASLKPPTQVVAAAANVSPQRRIHCRREASGPMPISSANVLVVNKELVEIRQRSGPIQCGRTRWAGRTGSARRATRSPCSRPIWPCATRRTVGRDQVERGKGQQRDRVPATRGGPQDRDQSSPQAVWERKDRARRGDHTAHGALACRAEHQPCRRSLRAPEAAS